MSGYQTIRLSEPNPTILRASESNFLESNTIWPIPYPTFSKFGAKFGKKGVIFDEIFDFLGIRIRLFEILNYPNRSESDFLISDNICTRLFGIRSFTSINSSEIKIMIFFFSLEIHIDVVFSSLEMNWMMLHGWPYLLYQNDSPWNVQRIKTHSRLKPKKSVLNLWVKLTSSHKRILS